MLLGLEQDVRARDDGRRVGRIDLEHVVELGQGRCILALLPVEVGAADPLVVGGRVLGVVEDRGDLALGERPLALGDIGGDQLPAVAPWRGCRSGCSA